MKDKLENLPLFTGMKGRLKSNYDFSSALGMDDVQAIFKLKKNELDSLLDYCQKNEIDINSLLMKFIATFLEEKKH